ncbi:MAG: GGDEF domain-containing protein [Deltaproteobacteria bacterium]|nr:GGDEF domain-containing protein [Deltaproteobacteria bacterium]
MLPPTMNAPHATAARSLAPADRPGPEAAALPAAAAGPALSVSRWAATVAVGVALVAAIGWLDHATGPEVGLSLVYLVPVTVVGWLAGRRAGLLLALGAAAAWFAADVAQHAEGYVPVAGWNAFTRLAIYAAIGLLAARVRSDRLRLVDLNGRLARALDAERTLARTDGLTGLANSRSFLETLRIETARSRRARTPICVAYLDLDNFKRVNDRHGHAAGDDLLRRIADELRDVVRTSDVVARLGGDEFGILLWQVEPAPAEEIGRRIVERVAAAAAPYPEADVGASVGLVWYAVAPDRDEELLQEADGAMYDAKQAGKHAVMLRTGS